MTAPVPNGDDPRPISLVFAFCRTAPSVHLIAFATSITGVLAFE
jgi:hypothetical protein